MLNFKSVVYGLEMAFSSVLKPVHVSEQCVCVCVCVGLTLPIFSSLSSTYTLLGKEGGREGREGGGRGEDKNFTKEKSGSLI